MEDNMNKEPDFSIKEDQDGSAVVDVPEDLLQGMEVGGEVEGGVGQNDEPAGQDADADHPDDDEELRQAKRNRRRAKKELIRKTNQEKDARLAQLQRENEEFKRRLMALERNTKSEQVTRIDKNIEDAQVRLEYAKMKLAEATQNSDGNAMVEAQALWQQAQDEVRNLSYIRQQAEQELRQQPQDINVPNPDVQRYAAQWMKRNDWYDPTTRDADSRIAKKIDELLVTQGWDPATPEYWDELDSRLQRELPHRYNDDNDERIVKRPRNVVGSSGREASAAYGGSNRTQFVLSPERVAAMKAAGAWDNPERKARMIKQFIDYDRNNGRR